MTKAQEYISKAEELYFTSEAARVAREALLEIWDDLSPRLNETEQVQLSANLLIAMQNMLWMENELSLYQDFVIEVDASRKSLSERLTNLQNKEEE